MAMRTRRMTLGQWKASLGPAVPVEWAANMTGLSPGQLSDRIDRGLTPVHTFRAADGRVFRMIRIRDLRQQAPPPKPKLSIQAMAAALRKMMEQG